MRIYTKWTFSVADDGLMALLASLPFESFEENGGFLNGYILTTDCNDELELQVNEFATMFDATYEKYDLPYENWNSLWESNFTPVEVRDFCRIRADFHTDEKDHYKHQLTINPKMAFGTGHHQTTFMMIDAMANIDFYKKTVFDYGCGTGILAILASRLGSGEIVAVDIEEESYLNTIENANINSVENIKTYAGDLSVVTETNFDIILANINRNVLLDSCYSLILKLNAGGLLLLSGILIQDKEVIVEAYQKQNVQLVTEYTRDNWMCLLFMKI